VTTPLEIHRWLREHLKAELPMGKPFAEVYDYAESLQQALATEQQARHAAEQDAQHWREACQDALARLERLRLASLRCPQCGSENVMADELDCWCKDCGHAFDADEALP
jgi:Zn finger protein HypA/HybF involved in hydrogenase expression